MEKPGGLLDSADLLGFAGFLALSGFGMAGLLAFAGFGMAGLLAFAGFACLFTLVLLSGELPGGEFAVIVGIFFAED